MSGLSQILRSASASKAVKSLADNSPTVLRKLEAWEDEMPDTLGHYDPRVIYDLLKNDETGLFSVSPEDYLNMALPMGSDLKNLGLSEKAPALADIALGKRPELHSSELLDSFGRNYSDSEMSNYLGLQGIPELGIREVQPGYAQTYKHDGRNRALANKFLGVEKMPVAVNHEYTDLLPGEALDVLKSLEDEGTQVFQEGTGALAGFSTDILKRIGALSAITGLSEELLLEKLLEEKEKENVSSYQ